MITLQIEQTYAKLGMQNQNAKLQLETTRPELMINTEPAKVEISGGKSTLSIDQTALRYSFGLKNVTDFGRDNAKSGMEALANWVGQIAAEGARLAQIEKGGNPIAEMAREKTIKPLIDLTWAPLEKPDIRFELIPLRFDVTPAKLDIQIKLGEVKNETIPGKLDIYLAQKNSITITTTGSMDLRA